MPLHSKAFRAALLLPFSTPPPPQGPLGIVGTFCGKGVERGGCEKTWQKEVFWFLSINKLLFYIRVLREGHSVHLPIQACGAAGSLRVANC